GLVESFVTRQAYDEKGIRPGRIGRFGNDAFKLAHGQFLVAGSEVRPGQLKANGDVVRLELESAVEELSSLGRLLSHHIGGGEQRDGVEVFRCFSLDGLKLVNRLLRVSLSQLNGCQQGSSRNVIGFTADEFLGSFTRTLKVAKHEV